jgi:tetratricopeptide (TPR) repeat protein
MNAKAAVDGAKALHYEPVMAEALFIQGSALIAVGNTDEGIKSLTDAAWAAERGRRDDLVAAAGLSAAMLTSDALGNPDKARIWLGLGEAAAARLGVDPQFELRVLATKGLVEAEAGDLNAAMLAHEKMLAVAESLKGRADPSLWAEELMLATTQTRGLAYAKAVPHFEHGLALREGSVGPDHSDIALILSNLGICYSHLHDKRARPTFDRALALREKLFGKNSPLLVPTLDNFAALLKQEGDLAGALALLERAKKMAALLPGKEHPAYHTVASDHAAVLVSLGRLTEAHAAFDELLVIAEKVHSATLPAILTARAELALAEKAFADAVTFAQRAIAGYEAAGGAQNPELWQPLSLLARADLGLGKVAEARPLLERAIALGEKIQLAAQELAPIRVVLAEIPSKP